MIECSKSSSDLSDSDDLSLTCKRSSSASQLTPSSTHLVSSNEKNSQNLHNLKENTTKDENTSFNSNKSTSNLDQKNLSDVGKITEIKSRTDQTDQKYTVCKPNRVLKSVKPKPLHRSTTAVLQLKKRPDYDRQMSYTSLLPTENKSVAVTPRQNEISNASIDPSQRRFSQPPMRCVNHGKKYTRSISLGIDDKQKNLKSVKSSKEGKNRCQSCYKKIQQIDDVHKETIKSASEFQKNFPNQRTNNPQKTLKTEKIKETVITEDDSLTCECGDLNTDKKNVIVPLLNCDKNYETNNDSKTKTDLEITSKIQDKALETDMDTLLTKTVKSSPTHSSGEIKNESNDLSKTFDKNKLTDSFSPNYDCKSNPELNKLSDKTDVSMKNVSKSIEELVLEN